MPSRPQVSAQNNRDSSAIGVSSNLKTSSVGRERTSVKQVISELQANFTGPAFALGGAKGNSEQVNQGNIVSNNNNSYTGGKKRDQHNHHHQHHRPPPPLHSDHQVVHHQLDKSDDTSTGTRRVLLNSSKNMIESDSSFEKQSQLPTVTTTVSVSTCPSCGSENVSSSPSASTSAHRTKARRSASFQQLNPVSVHRKYSSCDGCHRTAQVYRSHSFTSYKCPDYDSDKQQHKVDMLLKCDCGACRVRHKKLQAKKYQHANNGRNRREPMKKKRSKHRNGQMSRSFSGLTGTEHLHQCSSVWCTKNKLVPPSATATVKPILATGSAYKSQPLSPWVPPLDGPRKKSGHGHQHHQHHHRLSMPSSADYRFWDVEDWRAQMKREKAREKEKAILMLVSAIGIIVFVCVCYFGTLLFLRVTKLP
ncbi:hypothetical protein HDE_05090 [Halotydeus destructor]|nr:hypothetical protein HDE_05090 [Halotydeus destructor]